MENTGDDIDKYDKLQINSNQPNTKNTGNPQNTDNPQNTKNTDNPQNTKNTQGLFSKLKYDYIGLGRKITGMKETGEDGFLLWFVLLIPLFLFFIFIGLLIVAGVKGGLGKFLSRIWNAIKKIFSSANSE